MSSNLIKTLQDAGLSEKEAKIYITLSELGLTTVFEIAKQSGLNRSSTYVVLESLKKKGLAGTSPDKPVTQYFASSPDSLLHSASTRAKHEQDVKNNLEQILPELKALHKDTRHRPKVRVYEGLEGVKAVYWDILMAKEAKDLKTYSNAGEIFRLFPNFMEHTKERIIKGIKMYAINPATKESLELLKNLPTNLPTNFSDEFTIVPENIYKFPIDMAIYGDKVAFASTLEKFGIIIEQKDIAQVFRNVFNLAWEESKRLDKEIKKKYFRKR